MTNRLKYLKKKKLKDKPYSLKELSKISGYPLNILKEVFKRGVGAHKNNPGSVRRVDDPIKRGGSNIMSPEQWAYARVYSFLNKGTTWYKTDKDLADKIKSKLS